MTLRFAKVNWAAHLKYNPMTKFLDNYPSLERVISPDRLVGFDKFNQLWAYEKKGDSFSGTIVRDVRNHTCPVCGKGWELSGPSFLDQDVFNRNGRSLHRRCVYGVEYISQARFVFGIKFDNSPHDYNKEGDKYKYEEIPNQYWGKDYPIPYWIITRKDQIKIEIGHRKRVWSIKFYDISEIQVKGIEEIFKEYKPTKQAGLSEWLFHAYTDEEAKEWISKIVDYLNPKEEKDTPSQ